MYTSLFLALGLFIAAPLVSAYGLIASPTGGLGGNGTGLGVVSGVSTAWHMSRSSKPAQELVARPQA